MFYATTQQRKPTLFISTLELLQKCQGKVIKSYLKLSLYPIQSPLIPQVFWSFPHLSPVFPQVQTKESSLWYLVVDCWYLPNINRFIIYFYEVM